MKSDWFTDGGERLGLHVGKDDDEIVELVFAVLSTLLLSFCIFTVIHCVRKQDEIQMQLTTRYVLLMMKLEYVHAIEFQNTRIHNYIYVIEFQNTQIHAHVHTHRYRCGIAETSR